MPIPVITYSRTATKMTAPTPSWLTVIQAISGTAGNSHTAIARDSAFSIGGMSAKSFRLAMETPA